MKFIPSRIVAIITTLVMVYIGCSSPAGPSDPGGGENDIPVSFNGLVANGSPTETTTKLTLTFDKDITDLSAENIVLTANSTGAVKGTLTRTGTGTYELTVNNVSSSGDVSVSVMRAGYAISGNGKTTTIYHYVDPSDIPVAFNSLTANGSTTETTSKLTLTFDKDIDGFAVSDITLTAGSTDTDKGTLSKTGTGTYELGVSGITASGQITVEVNKDGYAIVPTSQNVHVNYYAPPIDVSFKTLTANGSTTETTSKLTLTFDKDIEGFAVSDITLTGSIGAVKGTLTRTGTGTYELGVSGITVPGQITATVSKGGYNITPGSRDAPVTYYVPPIDVSFKTLTANGSTTETTSKLTLTFDKDIDGLMASDITLTGSTGAVKGTLARTGIGTYELGVSGITVPGQITATVSKGGYTITPSSKEATVTYYQGTVSFLNLTANGGNYVTTDKLTLTFDRDIPGLTAADITYTPPVPAIEGYKGNLIAKGGGVYELEIDGIRGSSQVSATIKVQKAGYDISPAERNFYVYYAIPVTFSSVSQNGSANATTTKLTIRLSEFIHGLSASHITLGGNTGASTNYNSLRNVGGPTGGDYELDVFGITRSGQLTVTFSNVPYSEYSGYVISPKTQSVQVYHYAEPVTFNGVTVNGSGTVTTTSLTLNFNKDIAGLTASDITLTPGSTGAVKGALNRTGTGIYELGVSGISSAGSVNLSVAKPGYAISGNPKQVNVNYAIPAVFSSLTANGSPTETTSKLTLTFDKDIAGLMASDITLTGGTGAVKGTLTRTGTGTYELGVSGINAAGQVTVAVNKNGYAISGGQKQVNVSYVIPVAFTGLAANGSPREVTTKLTLTFNKDIAGLAAPDITLTPGSTGAVKGALNKTGTGVYELGISGIGSSGQVTVAVNKAGYIISQGPRQVQVYPIPGTATLSITFNQIIDAAPAITGPVLYRVTHNGPTAETITLDNPGQYSSINWRVQDTSVTGTGSTFTLNAANSAYNLIGEHFVTVSVIKNGKPYNKTVSFKVEY